MYTKVCEYIYMATDTNTLFNELQGLVAQVTNSLLRAKAQLALEQYIDSEKAFSNINASAAVSYSDARGTVNKRAAEIARQQADDLYGRLEDLLNIGGVDFIITDNAVAYWDLTGLSGA